MPYISTNKAIMNAENAPNDRQSRGVSGLTKLNANRMKTALLAITRNQRP